MYYVLIVDDEKIIRQGLIHILKKSIKEQVEYLEASNGIEAQKYIEEQLIHLIITDINMPLCDGLEFIKSIKIIDPSILSIIISGYKDFEYAQKAIRLGAKDYLIKPINKSELIGAVENCMVDIKNNQQQKLYDYFNKKENYSRLIVEKQGLLYELLMGRISTERIQVLEEFEVSLKASYYRVCTICYEIESEFEEYIDFVVKNIVEDFFRQKKRDSIYTINYRKGCLAVLFLFNKMKDKEEIEHSFNELIRCIEQYVRVCAAIGVSEIIVDKQLIHQAFIHSLQASDLKIYSRSNKIFYYEEFNKKNESFKAVYQYKLDTFDCLSEQEVLAFVDRQKKEEPSIQQVIVLKRIYNKVLEKIKQHNDEDSYFEYISKKGKHFSNLWSFFELRREIDSVFEYIDYIATIEEESYGNNFINEVLEFTKKHIVEDIDLSFIAKHFMKTPGYIGTLFKKETKIRFVDFITQERIKLAQTYLRDETIPIYEVARLCGYYNSKYFAVVFRRIVHCSPTQYRAQLSLSKSTVK